MKVRQWRGSGLAFKAPRALWFALAALMAITITAATFLFCVYRPSFDRVNVIDVDLGRVTVRLGE